MRQIANGNNRRNVVIVWSVLMFILSVALNQSFADQWEVNLFPAALRSDKTVHLVAGYTQPVFLMLQASDDVFKQQKQHDIDIKLTLPSSIKLLDYSGFSSRGEMTSKQANGKTIYTIPVKVGNPQIAGKVGGKVKSEWKSLRLYWAVPTQLLKNEKPLIEVKIKEGKNIAERKSKIVLHPSSVAGVQTKLTRIGLWCYGYGWSGGASSKGLAEFLQHFGIRHIQKGSDALYPQLRQHNITLGASCHRSVFYDPHCDNIDAGGTHANGTKADGSKSSSRYLWPCPASSIARYDDPVKVPGVNYMVRMAKSHDGIATLDYEPGARWGFSEKAIELFKKATNTTDEQIKQLRSALVEHGRKIYVIKDQEILSLYRKWVEWKTEQNAGYVKLLDDGFHKLYPEGRFELTPTSSYIKDGADSLAHGIRSVELAPYVDVIQPQIYRGYGDKASKSVMTVVRGWRKAMDERNARADLHPILLTRYAGATVSNSPERLHQQIIGVVAEGAQGVMLYYADQMDALYWLKLVETTRCLDRFERFYHQGKRVTDQFVPVDMPRGYAEIRRWPAHKETVKNPEWNVTVHRLDDRILLTLFNLSECDDALFKFNIPQGWELSETDQVKISGDGWLVSPKKIGFVILKQSLLSKTTFEN